MVDVALAGCRPEPLGSYLKALAVLRLVAEQKDARAKGYWKDDVFHLVSTLDEEALVDFFTKEYAPTPLVGPWGARSGFFSASSERSAREALNAIEKSRLPRLASFREVVSATRECMKSLGIGVKVKDAQKMELMLALRDSLPDAALRWLDAAFVLGGSTGERGFPIILGTGGNEGSQGFSSTFMQALEALGILGVVDPALVRNALFDAPVAGAPRAATGHFSPGSTPGTNQGPGFSGGASASALDMALAFEGAATWVSGAVKRHGSAGFTQFSSPFTVRGITIGMNGAARDDAKARGEIWAPLWSQPSYWREIEALLAEGRASWRGHPARTAIDLAKAAASLGVDRGIEGFERFVVLDRNGKSFFAISEGRYTVFERSAADLLRELDIPLGVVDRQIRSLGDNAPQRLLQARRRLDEVAFHALRTPDESRMLSLLECIGRLAKVLASMDGGRRVLRAPLRGMSGRWLTACGDSVELRTAAAIASIRGDGKVGPLAANLIPIDPARPSAFATGRGQVAWEGNTPAARLSYALGRRLMDFERFQCERLPLDAHIGLAPEDAVAFLHDATDDQRLENLLFALTWIDWRPRELREARRRWRRPIVSAAISPFYAMLKLVLDPRSEHQELRVVPLLRAGRVDEAIDCAANRLRATGARPICFRPVTRNLPSISNPSIDPLRLAACLLIPTRGKERLLQMITHPEPRTEA